MIDQIDAQLSVLPPDRHETFLRGVRSMYERRLRQAQKGQFHALSIPEIKSILSHVKGLLDASKSHSP